MEAYLKKENGVCTMDKEFAFMCSLLRNGEYTVTIKRKTKPRTLNQKGLYFVWIGHIGQCFAQEFGDVYWSTSEGKDWLHQHYADKFLPKIEKNVGGHIVHVRRSTESLTTAEMSAYMERIKVDVATEHGINLPLPQDRYYSAFIDQYESIKNQ